MRHLLVIVIALISIAGCSGRVEKDDRPSFTIDSSKPFRLEFGRGSGWRGLDTVKIDQTGLVVLHRMKYTRQGEGIVQSLEITNLQLSPDVVAEVLKTIQSNGLMKMHKAYYDPNIRDGTQWVLWIKQGEREKSVYFNNSFPHAITSIAKQLDSILSRAGLDNATWQATTDQEHEKELWDSIKH